jgi:hypothetical protein
VADLPFIIGLPEAVERLLGAPLVLVCPHRHQIALVEADTASVETCPVLPDDHGEDLLSFLPTR